jgi:hypothetical protein
VYLDSEGIFGSSSRRTRHKFTRHESDVCRWLEVPAVAERLRLNLPRQWIYACVILGQKGKVRNGYRKKLYV